MSANTAVVRKVSMPDAEIKSRLPIPFFRVLRRELQALGHSIDRPEPIQADDWDIAEEDQQRLTDADKAKFVGIRTTVDGADARKPNIRTNADGYLNQRHLFTLSPTLAETVKSFKEWLAQQPSGSVEVHSSESSVDPVTDDKRHLVRLMFEEKFTSLPRVSSVRLHEVYREIHAKRKDDNLFKRGALCLSGGGIRSATFGLGIMQGLASKGLMDKVHYVSTVSGGGYIGSWLTAWMKHSKKTTEVIRALTGENPQPERNDLAWNEPSPIRFLRAYSNYLTPKVGMFSADTWVLIATYFRNLLLNWLVFIPLLVAVAGSPCLYYALVRWFALPEQVPACLPPTLFGVGAAALALMVAYSVVARPSKNCKACTPGRVWFHCLCLLPAIIAALCFSLAWAWTPWSLALPGDFDVKSFLSHSWWLFPILGVLIHCSGWSFGQWFLSRRQKRLKCSCSTNTNGSAVSKNRWAEFVSAFVTGVVGGWLLWLVAKIFGQPQDDQFFYAALSVPAILVTILLVVTLFVGFTAFWTTDEDREWWARMGGWFLIPSVAWSLICLVSFGGPYLFFEATTIATSIGGITGLYTLIAGHSGATPATAKAQGQKNSIVSLDVLLKVAAPVFVAVLFAAFAILFVWALNIADVSHKRVYAGSYGQYIQALQNFDLGHHVLVYVMLAAIAWLCSIRINLNRFSLHAVYRNRLVRAYLGASNPDRKPHPFTGFDPADNFSICKVEHNRPLHIVNMALNLVSGSDLAWQERKAETFTASKFHSGNYHLGYRSSVDYASLSPRDAKKKKKHPEQERSDKGQSTDEGITLGSAMAISGAAANSNMGYHSSSVLCFLLTLFNLRLGCWLGNPGIAGNESYKNECPDSAGYMLREIFGLTDNTYEYVMLSDGGHFENLGLYEMVLRRCDWIVVSDGGCDPDCSLEDFGNAIRKIRTDLGIPISLKQFGIYSRNDERFKNLEKAEVGKYCAIAEIDYAAVDGKDRDGKVIPGKKVAPGLIVYFKASLNGTEPKDVFNYKSVHPEFPHESTADQWFSESQFESYRALGAHAIEHACSVASRQRIEDSLTPKEQLNGVASFIAEIHNYIATDGTTYKELPLADPWREFFYPDRSNAVCGSALHEASKI